MHINFYFFELDFSMSLSFSNDYVLDKYIATVDMDVITRLGAQVGINFASLTNPL